MRGWGCAACECLFCVTQFQRATVCFGGCLKPKRHKDRRQCLEECLKSVCTSVLKCMCESMSGFKKALKIWMFLHLKGRMFDSADLRTGGEGTFRRMALFFFSNWVCKCNTSLWIYIFILYNLHAFLHHSWLYSSVIVFFIPFEPPRVQVIQFHSICRAPHHVRCVSEPSTVHASHVCGSVWDRWLPQAHCHNWSFSPAMGHGDQGNAGSVFDLRDNGKHKEGRPL